MSPQSGTSTVRCCAALAVRASRRYCMGCGSYARPRRAATSLDFFKLKPQPARKLQNRSERAVVSKRRRAIPDNADARLVPSRKPGFPSVGESQPALLRGTLFNTLFETGPSTGRATASLACSLVSHRPSIIYKSPPTNIDAGIGPCLGQGVLRSRQFDIECRSTTPWARSVY
jgi:hypothetical protein